MTGVSAADGRDGVTGFQIEAAPGRDVRREVSRAVVTKGWGLLELRAQQLSLEDIFLQLTTEEAAAEGDGTEGGGAPDGTEGGPPDAGAGDGAAPNDAEERTHG